MKSFDKGSLHLMPSLNDSIAKDMPLVNNLRDILFAVAILIVKSSSPLHYYF